MPPFLEEAIRKSNSPRDAPRLATHLLCAFASITIVTAVRELSTDETSKTAMLRMALIIIRPCTIPLGSE